ncbi:MAG: IS110 family transposase [Bacteroidota bacterium]
MSKRTVQFSMVHPHAAGIDVGSKSHWVCAGQGKDYIRQYDVFTEDLHELSNWLKSLGVQTIAMESTGSYWKSLFLLLQDHGFEVILVHATHVKNVRGKKSDIQDCQWIWQLHSAGLLSPSFQPDELTESLRAYTRHRKSLIQGAARYISKMQKALVVQNIHLSVVLTDITGKSGKAIIEAILSGERDEKKLAALADPRVKKDKQTIAKALKGHWKYQHLFELRQSWQMYQFYHQQIAQCDMEIEKILQAQIKANSQQELVYEPKKKRSGRKMTLLLI